MAPADTEVCDEGEKGLLLPLLGDTEQRWPAGLRIPLYMLGLFWCFMGVALIAEKFMAAIERVTAKEVRKYNPKTGRHITVLVWNETVANLTLMALGSSAPEILLSVIELVFMNQFFSGNLGPSTIVGSAAFNLFMITAVCIYVIPDNEVRSIAEVPVYIVTAIFSVFAYVWLLVILILSSPDIVDIWEGVATFLFFPILVSVAYAADRGVFTPSSKPEGGDGSKTSRLTKEELAEFDAIIRTEQEKATRQGVPLSAEQKEKIESIVRQNFLPRTSRATYRVCATRKMTAGKRVDVPNVGATMDTLDPVSKFNKMTSSGIQKMSQVAPIEEENFGDSPQKVKVEFADERYAVLENAGHVTLTVLCKGDPKGTVTVNFETKDGSATKDTDYTEKSGVLTFEPGDTLKTIDIEIIDDAAYEEDEEFYVTLADPKHTSGECALGLRQMATVLIIDDDIPGELQFPEDTFKVIQKIHDQEILVVVERRGGATGKISCKYSTVPGSALPERDYTEADGVLEFDHGIMSQTIPLIIKGRGRYESTEQFKVILTEPTGGAKFNKDSDGGAERCILTVQIDINPEESIYIDRMFSALRMNWDRATIGHSNWRDQFRDSLFVNGAGEGNEPPQLLDLATHIICVPWKLIFALVPPTDYCQGWVCFCCSLLMIGGVTLLVGELAALLGCVMKIGPEITSITLVALGTSLPDTFASKEAAINDATADASIVNVTGSNSVNVFLGLGLPWMFGAIYWAVRGRTDDWLEKYEGTKFDTKCPNGCFVVEAGGVAFSVAVFSACAAVGLITLGVRRVKFGGELGGPTGSKIRSSIMFASLWVIYVAASATYVLLIKD